MSSTAARALLICCHKIRPVFILKWRCLNCPLVLIDGARNHITFYIQISIIDYINYHIHKHFRDKRKPAEAGFLISYYVSVALRC